jgi:hypothetical protein
MVDDESAKNQSKTRHEKKQRRPKLFSVVDMEQIKEWLF